MNISTDNAAVASDNKRILAWINPQTWSIKWKARMNFFLRAVIAIFIIAVTVGLFQRRIAIREARSKVLLLSDSKSRYIEDYFKNINQQLRSFSNDRQTIEALNQLSEAFLNIESDSYLTATATSQDKINSLVEGFYASEVLPELNGTADQMINLQTLLPTDNKQRILQYLFLAANSKPMGAKHTVTKSDDASAYGYLHAQYHPEMLNFARQAGVADILLIDYKSGYVTYSMKKNLDFATNLFEGPYKNSGLGRAFKSALGQKAQGSVTYIDATQYVPALLKPIVFISTPLFSGSQLSGVLVFAIDISTMDNLLTLEKEGIFSGESLKTIIVGSDYLYRNNDPEFLADRTKYVRKLKNNAGNKETASNVERLGTTAMIQGIDPLVFTQVLKGNRNLSRYTSETGNRVFCNYSPLKIENLDWMLVSQIDKREAMAPARQFLLIVIIVAFLIFALLYALSAITGDKVANRLNNLGNSVLAMSRGEKARLADSDNSDEIGHIALAVNQLGNRINEAADFVMELGKDNIDIEFSVSGEDDRFGHSLNSLKKSLVLRREEEEKRKQDDELRNWTAHGIAMFNDILRMDNNNLEKLALNITRNIIQYLSANQGGLFLIEEEDNNKYLNLVASYAFERRKYLNKRIEIGEGLAGTCVLEKKTILLNKIPDDYIAITSGLGGSKPGCLMIVPLKKEDEVLGVLEVASFNIFKPHEVEFVEKVAESIASALITVRLHLQTSQYLERFQQQSEEMKAQDEELRQNIEELQATHEQIERLKQEDEERHQKVLHEMEDYRKLLLNVLDHIPGKIFIKDDQGKLLMLNSEVAKVYGKTVEELLGTSDFDNHPPEEAKKYREQELEIMEKGASTFIQEESLGKEGTKFLKTTKMPFYLPHLKKTGLLGIQLDVTEFVKIQREKEEQEKELQKEKILLDALLTTFPEHIYFKDKQSRFLRFSQTMVKLFGLEKAEDLVGKSDFDFFSEEHSKPAFEAEQEIIRTGKPIINLEEKEVMADGRVSWVNTTKMPLRDANGEIIGTFGISKNITHLKKLETEALEMMKEIEGNRKLLIDVLDKIPAKIFLKNENGAFVIVNMAVASLYHKTPEQIIGTSDYDNHPGEDVDSWRAQELDIINTGAKVYIHKEEQDGKVRYLNTMKMPFVLATTGKTGLLGIQFDVTEKQLLEERLEEVNKEIAALRKRDKGQGTRDK